MKCPECGGETKIIHWTADQPRYLTCERCGGSGQVDSMTNMEWLQSMSVEQLAEWLCDITGYEGICSVCDDCTISKHAECRYKEDANGWMEWLKQPHTIKE